MTIADLTPVNKWVVAGKFTMYASKPFIIAGFIGWGAMTLVAVTSLPWVRKAWFGVFEVSAALRRLCYNL